MPGARENSFDEIELVHLGDAADFPSVEIPLSPLPERPPAPRPTEPEAGVPQIVPASRLNRVLALATDLSLFAAVGLALSPLVETGPTLATTFSQAPLGISSLLAFLLLLSLYYFPLCWMIWGRTVGAALFDLRVVADDGGAVTAPQAAKRWIVTLLSLITALVGFVPGLLPSRRTVADRVSHTHVVKSRD